jgi:hypothetical protein
MTKLWLSDHVFSWDVGEYQSGHCLDTQYLKRAYELWNHANKTLSVSGEEFYRVDAIATLKRSLNQRLKLIERIYQLKNVAEKNSPKDYLSYLETFGVIRSFLLKNLLVVRNDIEHNDAEPPSYERCVELLDSVWYFLRSTDEMVRVQRYECTYEASDNNLNKLIAKIHYDKNHKLEVWGWIPPEYISDVCTPNYSELEIIEVRKKDDIDYSGSSDHDISQLAKIINSQRSQRDILIQGFLSVPNQLKRQIIRDALCAL